MKKLKSEIYNLQFTIESGASLVFSLILMAFLTLISYSLVRLVNYESHKEFPFTAGTLCCRSRSRKENCPDKRGQYLRHFSYGL